MPADGIYFFFFLPVIDLCFWQWPHSLPWNCLSEVLKHYPMKPCSMEGLHPEWAGRQFPPHHAMCSSPGCLCSLWFTEPVGAAVASTQEAVWTVDCTLLTHLSLGCHFCTWVGGSFQSYFKMTNFPLSLVTIFPTSSTCAFVGVSPTLLLNHSKSHSYNLHASHLVAPW